MGETKEKITWELIYFFSEVTLFSVDTQIINDQFGYKQGPVMGFSVLSEQTTSKFLKDHGSVASFLQQLQNTDLTPAKAGFEAVRLESEQEK